MMIGPGTAKEAGAGAACDQPQLPDLLVEPRRRREIADANVHAADALYRGHAVFSSLLTARVLTSAGSRAPSSCRSAKAADRGWRRRCCGEGAHCRAGRR